MDVPQTTATPPTVSTTGDSGSQGKALTSAQRSLDVTALTAGLGPVPAALVGAIAVALTRAWDAGVEAAMADAPSGTCDPASPVTGSAGPLPPDPRARATPAAGDGLAEDAERRAQTFARADREGVAVVDGYGVRVVVERGHLCLADGIGPERRERYYPKADPGVSRVVCANPEGVVSFEALRWCAGAGVALVVLSADGATLAASPASRADARLLRAQAFLPGSPCGLEVSRYLIAAKLDGQASLLAERLAEADAAGTLRRLRDALDDAGSLEEVRQLEAAAANVYWASWERTAKARFAAKDRLRVPGSWERFNGRRSAVNPGSPRSATDPIGALLNYSYRLAEIEAATACRRIGLDPDLGVLHADMGGRASFALDVLEAVRPRVDRHVLDVAAGPLRKRCFFEDARGVVRLLAPLTHDLAAAMPAYGAVLGPVVETVAAMVAKASPYDPSVPSVLTHSKHRVAARQRVDAERRPVPRGPNPGGLAPRGNRPKPASGNPPLPLAACAGCGGSLDTRDGPVPRREWCAACLPERRAQVGGEMQAASLAQAARFAQATGHRPSHTPTATESRREANRAQREAQRSWQDTGTERTAFSAEEWEAVRVRLERWPLGAIALSVGVSTSTASKWRSGRRRPHPRHWPTLAHLAGLTEAAGFDQT